MLDKGSPEVAELIAALRSVTPKQQPWVRDMLIRELRLLLPKDKWSLLVGLSYGALCALLMASVGTTVCMTVPCTLYMAVPCTLLAALVSSRIANDPAVRSACYDMGTKVGTWAARMFKRAPKAE